MAPSTFDHPNGWRLSSTKIRISLLINRGAQALSGTMIQPFRSSPMGTAEGNVQNNWVEPPLCGPVAAPFRSDGRAACSPLQMRWRQREHHGTRRQRLHRGQRRTMAGWCCRLRERREAIPPTADETARSTPAWTVRAAGPPPVRRRAESPLTWFVEALPNWRATPLVVVVRWRGQCLAGGKHRA
jgi:hypothetical protein